MIEGDEGLAALNAESCWIELRCLLDACLAAPICQFGLHSERPTVFARNRLTVRAPATDQVGLGDFSVAALARRVVTFPVTVPATTVLQCINRSRLAAVGAPRLVLIAVVAKAGLVVSLALLIPSADDCVRPLALRTVADRRIRTESTESKWVDVVRHWVEVVVTTEEVSVLAEHRKPFVRCRAPIVTGATLTLKRMPEETLDLKREVAPHELPVALGLVLV